MVTTSAPGKLLLFGEHAVVYGQPCIVTAVSERLTVTVEKIDDTDVGVSAPQVKDTRFVDAAIAHAQSAWQIPASGYKVSTSNGFSSVNGFGSSAAVTVALLKTLAVFFNKDVSNKALFDLAHQVVRDVQKVGSGVDIAASCYGGTLLFRTGGEEITPLDIDISHVAIVVAYSGVKADTATLIDEVARKQEQYPEKTNRIFEAIGKLTLDAKQKMEEGDWERVGKFMDFNQEYLRDLGVSSEKLESLISAAKKAGAWGAKLSGAGVGDCMIALCSPLKRVVVENALKKAQGQMISVSFGAEGVRVEP